MRRMKWLFIFLAFGIVIFVAVGISVLVQADGSSQQSVLEIHATNVFVEWTAPCKVCPAIEPHFSPQWEQLDWTYARQNCSIPQYQGKNITLIWRERFPQVTVQAQKGQLLRIAWWDPLFQQAFAAWHYTLLCYNPNAVAK